MITFVAFTSILTLAAQAMNDAGLQHPNSPVLIRSNHTFTEADDTWQQKVKQLKAVKIEEGCGRMQNRLVTFEDGSKACARYRLNTNLMQGEIYSYALAKLLQIPNLPPLAVTLPDLKTEQWSRVGSAILEANWQSSKLLILTKYISNTKDVILPSQLQGMEANSVTPKDVTPENMEMLAQWSDMIVFDYIVGNMDRLVNTLHNKQWNADIMSMPVHNLAQKDDSLIFFDNEDGLFHGYKILDRYSNFHEQSLQSLCVFRESTANSITRLVESDNLTNIITSLVQQSEPIALKYLPKLSSKTTKVLAERLSNVAEHIRTCKERCSI